MQRAFRGVLEGGIGAKYTADELIGHLVDAEWEERLQRACGRALEFRYHSYKAVKNILANGLDKIEPEQLSARSLFTRNLSLHQWRAQPSSIQAPSPTASTAICRGT